MRTYRADGLSEEDAKLAAMKEEERQHRLEAEHSMRHYSSPMGKGKPSVDDGTEESFPQPVSVQPEDSINNIVAGSVSAMANMFTGVAQESQEAPPKSPMRESQPGNASAAVEAVGTADSMGTPEATSAAERESPALVPVITNPFPKDATFRLSFGVISFGRKNSYESYATSIASVMQNTAMPDVTLSGVPIVESVEQDFQYMDLSGRDNVVRFVVTVACPFTVTAAGVESQYTQRLFHTVQSNIQNNNLL